MRNTNKICENCAHFNPRNDFDRNVGWCGLDLPSWVLAALKTPERAVHPSDTCSFFEEPK